MDRSYDKSVEAEYRRVADEYMRELNTGIDYGCYPPCNMEGIEAFKRCIREHKTYLELVGYEPDGSALYL